jgi:hypothetical protein
VLVGGTTGAGVILLSLLMATGLEGSAVIATDATVSIVMGVVKLSVFGLAGVLTPAVLAVGLLIGGIGFFTTFIADRRAPAGPRPHRDARCGGDRRRLGDDLRGAEVITFTLRSFCRRTCRTDQQTAYDPVWLISCADPLDLTHRQTHEGVESYRLAVQPRLEHISRTF